MASPRLIAFVFLVVPLALSGEALAALRGTLADPMHSVPVRGDKPNSASWVLSIDTRDTKKG